MKAANLLIDDDGTVLLGDLGVAASLCDEEAVPASTLPMNFEASSRHDHSRNTAAPSTKKLGKRKSFVGTVSKRRPQRSLTLISYHTLSHTSCSTRHSYMRGCDAFVISVLIRRTCACRHQPCWMAPELISGKQYDAKADIWSFGITAIELTQGRAPRSREAPARVLLKTYVCHFLIKFVVF